MGGGLIQLVAVGAQDIYLTGNPEITFFKAIYKRYTNFAKECIEQPLDGDETGRKSCILSRSADLVQEIYLKTTINLKTSNETVFNNKSYIYPMLCDATNLIKEVSILVGGVTIDKHYEQWLDIYNELFEKNHQYRHSMSTIGKFLYQDKNITLTSTELKNNITEDIYIPLRFWFNKNPGLALPLIALQYHDVVIILELNEKNKLKTFSLQSESTTDSYITETNIADYTFKQVPCEIKDTLSTVVSATPEINITLSDTKLLANYIYLDTEERRKFSQAEHEYLIEQIQFSGKETGENSNIPKRIILTYNHPIKALFWTTITTNVSKYIPSSEIILQLNGHDRFTPQPSDYFHLVQPYECDLGNDYSINNYTRKWSSNLYKTDSRHNISMYSFCLNPAKHQPSGTCNFSRIDRAILSINNLSNTDDLYMFALNYNVFKVVSGLGGLVYSS